MNRTNDLLIDAMDMLKTNSRTFYIPISRLVPGLKEAVTSAYLCMRAIDEIEDHSELPTEDKVNLLRGISAIDKASLSSNELHSLAEALISFPINGRKKIWSYTPVVIWN